MIIKKLRLQNYRKFKQAEFTFYNGLNVLMGQNEAGKTTIMEAISDGLFTDPTTKSKIFSDRAVTWQTGQEPKIELEIEHNVSKLLLIKDFVNKTVVLKNLDTGKETHDYSSTLAAVNQMLQIGNKTVFQATAFMSYAEIAQIGAGEDLTYALQNAVLTQDKVNVQKVIQDLRNEVKNIKVGLDRPAKYPGVIKQTMDDLQRVSADLQEKKALLIKVGQASKYGSESEQLLAEIGEKIKLMEQLLANHSKREDVEGKLKEVDQKLHGIQRVITAVEKLTKLVTALKEKMVTYQMYSTAEVNQKIGKIVELQGSIKSLTELAVPKPLPPQEILQRRYPFKESIGIGLITLIIYGIIIVLMSPPWPIVLVVMALYVVQMVIIIRRGLADMHRPLPKVEVEMVTDEQAIQQKKQAEDSLSKMLQQFEVKDVEEIYTNRAKYEAVKEEINEAEGELRGLLAEKTLADWQEELNKLLVTKKELESNNLTEDVKQAKLTAEEYLRTRKDLDALHIEQKKLEKQVTTHEVQVQETSVSAEEVARLEEQELVLRDKLNLAQRQLAIKELVLDTFEKSIHVTAQTVKDTVEKLINNYLPRLTQKRYQEVRLNRDLSLEIFSPEKNDWVVPSHLSRGTIDQIYFLFRIAFCEVLTKEEGTPLFLDDPFVTFDTERRGEMRKILLDIAKRHQIFLLTNYPEYEEWGTPIKILQQ